ncbi:MAG TPA: L,D-transpeptidase family protein [Gammaproteobacteria bacterium]|nr:L,D-transpeptidase family protein [Gammaproteobacteria bacterium]
MRKIQNVLIFLLISVSLPAYASDIVVTYLDGVCKASVAGKQYTCSMGRSGLSANKVEGDGTTPIGKFPLRELLYRPDRITKKELKGTSLPMHTITKDSGWCDDPSSPDYNKLVNLKTFNPKINHENLYRTDDAYDLILVVGYNDNPAIPKKGSAVFVRISDPKYTGTPGGIGFSKQDLLEIIKHVDRKSHIEIKQ